MNAPEPLLSRAGAAGLPQPHRIGAFEFQSVLSRGAAGFVYRAWDHALARPVAIKEYLPADLARREPDGRVEPVGPAAATLFERGRVAFVEEARALARCDHPSLVRVLHLVEADGTAYRVMPLLAGRTLLDLRRGLDRPPEEGALRALLDDLLGALEAFHQAAGPHGGVASDQVLLLEDDRAVLLGTGAARRALLPATGSTPASLSGDLFAVAEMARWCITGDAPPAAGLGVAEPLAATVDRLYFAQPAVHYSPVLLRALDGVLSRDPARRPQHPAQLREWLAGEAPPAAVPAPAPERPPAAAAPLPPPAPAAAPKAPVRPAMPPLDDLRAMPPFRAEPERRNWMALWGLLLAGALGVAGYAAWRMPSPAAHSVGNQGPPRQIGERAAIPPLPEAMEPPAAGAAGAPPAEPAAASAVPAPEPAAPSASVPMTTAPAAAPPPAPIVEPPAPPVAEAPAAPEPRRNAVRPATPPPSPRAACGSRSDFALYRCMQQQCALPVNARHPQCERLRRTDSVE